MCCVISRRRVPSFIFFFFNDTATTEIYTLSLHDALPIFLVLKMCGSIHPDAHPASRKGTPGAMKRLLSDKVLLRLVLGKDRKSTRLNSSHLVISYAVFCLKKKTETAPLLIITTHVLYTQL